MKRLVVVIALIWPLLAAAATPPGVEARGLINALETAFETKDWTLKSDVTWPDGRLCFAGGECIKFSNLNAGGIGIVHKTKFSGWAFATSKDRVICHVMEATRTYYDGEFSGLWSVGRARYLIIRRQGEWRILEKNFLSRRDFGSDTKWQRKQKR